MNNSGKTAAASLAVAGGLWVAYKGVQYLTQPKLETYTKPFTDVDHGGKLVAEVLKNHGVKFIFTLTGGHISPILVGCDEAGVKVVDVRHEVNTVFAADAISRLTGIPGVACVTAGPGLSNTITSVKNAQMAQSPVILLGGATSDVLKGKGSLQDIDQLALLKPHIKWYAHISRVSDIVPALEKAFAISQEGTPGPVFIEFPLDTLYTPPQIRKFFGDSKMKGDSLGAKVVNYYLDWHVEKILSAKEISYHKKPLPFDYPKHSKSQVNTFWSYLKKSKKPILVIGSQITSQNDLVLSGKLTQSLIQLGIPIYTSGMARGLLGSNTLALKHNRREALRDADLVILVGVVADFRLNYGSHIPKRAVLLTVNRDSVDLTKNIRPHASVLADPTPFLIELSNSKGSFNSGEWENWHKILLEKDLARDAKIVTDSAQKTQFVNPIMACRELERVIDEKSIIVADGGDFIGTAAYIVRPRGPLNWLDPGPFGTLGVGAGFAMAAQGLYPDSEVWLLWGDGACGFSIAEFDTFVRHRLPVIAVVGNDAAWMQILRGQEEWFKNSVAGKLEYTDYHIVAEGFGGKGFKVTTIEELGPALVAAKDFARTQRLPVLINICIGRTDFRAQSLSM